MAVVPDTGQWPTMAAAARLAVARFGDRELVVVPGRRVTVAEVDVRSRRLAGQLLASGVGKGTRVGIHLAFGPEAVIAFLAAARIGALVVPASTAHSAAELRRALRTCDVHTLITAPTLAGRDQLAFVEEAVPELRAASGGAHLIEGLPHLRAVWCLGACDRTWARRVDLDDAGLGVPPALLAAAEDDVRPADWLVVISTSGSTAEPKGVVHTHGAVLRKTAGAPGAALPPVKVYAAMPLFWVGGLLTLTTALQQGWTMVGAERFRADEALDLIEAERVSLLYAWHGMIAALREHPTIARRDLTCIPSLSASAAAARPFLAPLGMTETIGPHLDMVHPTSGADVPEHLRGSNGSSGPWFDHKLVDPDTGADLTADGDEGEVCVRGWPVMAGLYGRERHEVFDDDGWYHTGDRARVRDGLWFFTGRVSEMIKTRGANVAPPEVEAALEALPEVKLAVVVGLPDPRLEEVVVAVVVPATGARVDVASVQARLRDVLAGYKVPRRIEVLDDDEVPWLATGKVDKRALKERLAAVSTTWADPGRAG